MNNASATPSPAPPLRARPMAREATTAAGAPPMLRILSLAPTSFFGDYGCHVRILEEARALQAHGHRVTIVTYFKGSDVPGADIVRTRPTPWHAAYEVGSSRHKYAFDVLLAAKLAQTLLRARRTGRQFDVIHAHLHEGALIGSVLGKLARVPVCFDYQGSLTDEMLHHNFMRHNGKRMWFWSKVERFAEALPSATFTSTQHAAATLRARRLNARIVALPDGVNTSAFRPDVLSAAQRAEMRARHGITADAPVVVFLGLLAQHQGIECILQAAAFAREVAPDLRWLIMGYPGLDAWKSRARDMGLGDAVVFTGRVPYAEAPRALALGDIAIAPKLSLTEGSGKVLNYMAMGLPTVAFDTPGQREYLENLGVYAPLGDSVGLASRAIELCADLSRRQNIGRSLRQRAIANFSWDAAARNILSVYAGLLDKKILNAES